MKFSILIPHYKTGKMTAYAIHQLLKNKGRHEVDIIVIDNSNGEGVKYFDKYIPQPMPDNCRAIYLRYPKDKLQSHGIAFDFALEKMYDEISDYFITIESDSFPTQYNWLDYYESLINQGYDMAGSRMKLSGGEYIHPAGAMYKKSNWKEAKDYIMSINYSYMPNAAYKEGFKSHLMIHNSIVNDFLANPTIELVSNSIQENELAQIRYFPIAESVFHNGMGHSQEAYSTYGKRTIASETENAIIKETSEDLIYRMGYEPGQWFSYWHYATGKKVGEIPTEIKWMPNRINQQQEYTEMENGFHHIWGVTAYGGGEPDENTIDIYNRKKQLMEELYNSIQ